MAGYDSIAMLLANLGSGSSKHRTARVLRFLHRHPKAKGHAHLIGRMIKHEREREQYLNKKRRELAR
jgi:hypothetical protein